METYSRRAFSKTLTILSTSLVLKGRANGTTLQQTGVGVSIPESMAGYTLTEAEREHTANFLMALNKSLLEPRGRDLPNGLAPTFTVPNDAPRKF